jgi:N-acetylglucosaminyldiphosphoundecaprenol N-acetyl-beta-D-mannosaminyltransferase
MKKKRILNIEILSVTKDFLLENMNEGVLFTPNVDHLVRLQKDKSFYEIYQKADWVICDSKIVNLGAKFLSKPFVEVIPGSSFFTAFYEYHKKSNNKIFLLGAKEGVAKLAMQNINKKTNSTIICDFYSPSFGFETNEEECNLIIDKINASEANILVVGLGAPKQEFWIMKNKDKLNNIKLLMALGATIDFEAGTLKRAPKIFQKLSLEWFYRFLMEPKRLWRRYLGNFSFFYYIFKQKFNSYKNPFS